MKRLRNDRYDSGITLIALIITIIILLILAGVTVATLTNSGLFDKSKQAKEESENAIVKEETELAKYENEVNNYFDGTIESNRGVSDEEYQALLARLETKGLVAFYNQVFSGTSSSYRTVNLVNYNEHCATATNNVLTINKPGSYTAYLVTAHGQTNGGNGSYLKLFIDNAVVATAYFDRVSTNDTGAVVYDFNVSENETKNIELKILGYDNTASSNAAQTGTMLIIKND